LFTVSALPPFGAAANPSNNEVSAKYLTEGVSDTGALNIVASMFFDYRSFDTFGETCVLLAAVVAVFILMRHEGPRDAYDELLHEMEEPKQDVILKSTAAVLVGTMLIFGCYIILNGHLSAGGGFSGGAVLGAALILYTVAYGTRRAVHVINFAIYQRVVTSSLLFYALVKGYSIFAGANHLRDAIPLGKPGDLFSAGLILPLNIAVSLIVACSAYAIFILFSKGEWK